jgi:hypothetical protein
VSGDYGGKILFSLQKEAIVFNGVIIDSTTMNVHRRHGGGQKGATDQREESSGDKHEVSCGGGQCRNLVEGMLTGGDGYGGTERGYDSNEYRWALEGNNNEPVIP